MSCKRLGGGKPAVTLAVAALAAAVVAATIAGSTPANSAEGVAGRHVFAVIELADAERKSGLEEED